MVYYNFWTCSLWSWSLHTSILISLIDRLGLFFCTVLHYLIVPFFLLLRWKFCWCRVQIQCQHILQRSASCGDARRECDQVLSDFLSIFLPQLVSHLALFSHFSLQGLFSENKEKLINNAILALLSQEAEQPALNAELESHFQAIRRLVASKAGFQAFTQLPK